MIKLFKKKVAPINFNCKSCEDVRIYEEKIKQQRMIAHQQKERRFN